MARTVRGESRGEGLRIAVLVARWNADVTDRLLEGALAALAEAGVRDRDTTVVEVPGSFDLPAAAARVARSGRVEAVVALGCVLKGETRHDEVIAAACARGLVEVSVATGVPVTFGVVTADTHLQALERSDPDKPGGTKRGNKGREAAEAAVSLATALRRWERSP